LQKNTLENDQHPRDDYKELLELLILFLGDIPSHGVSFRKPGAFLHARWMAKAIYSLKIFLFRNEFELNTEEVNRVTDICFSGQNVYKILV
jgi:hypothetical protein